MSERLFGPAEACVDIIGEKTYGHGIGSSLGHNQVGIALGGLDIHLVHGFEHILIAVDHYLWGASALHAVACDYPDESVVGIGVDKYLNVHHLAEGGIVEHKDALDNHHIAGLDLNRFFLPGAGEVAVGGHFDGMARLKLAQMLGQQSPLDRGRFVEVDLAALFGRDVAGVFVIRVLWNDSDLSLRERI